MLICFRKEKLPVEFNVNISSTVPPRGFQRQSSAELPDVITRVNISDLGVCGVPLYNLVENDVGSLLRNTCVYQGARRHAPKDNYLRMKSHASGQRAFSFLPAYFRKQ
jgi:hypothetical protein